MISEEYARSVIENWSRLDLGDINVGPRQCFETIVYLYEESARLQGYVQELEDILRLRRSLTGQEA